MGAAANSTKPAQRRPVADEPDVPERVDEMALAMDTPRRCVVPEVVETARGARRQRRRVMVLCANQ